MLTNMRKHEADREAEVFKILNHTHKAPFVDLPSSALGKTRPSLDASSQMDSVAAGAVSERHQTFTNGFPYLKPSPSNGDYLPKLAADSRN